MKSFCSSGPAFIALLMFFGCAQKQHHPHQNIVWPDYGDLRKNVSLGSHVNNVPDVIGPVDGSAKLTILTEGNHYPILNSLVLGKFPEWCMSQKKCSVKKEEILLITLPQYMIVKGLKQGYFRFGNMVVPLEKSRVYPDIVMAGRKILDKLSNNDIIKKSSPINMIAKHKGMAILARKDSGATSLSSAVRKKNRFVFASKIETGARAQYLESFSRILPEKKAKGLLRNEVQFSERAYIQHRDVPYALLKNIADIGFIFDHLARFYAEVYSDRLIYIPIKQTDSLGKAIYWTRIENKNKSPLKFEEFFLSNYKKAYKDMIVE